jgi:hypothetical protein
MARPDRLERDGPRVRGRERQQQERGAGDQQDREDADASEHVGLLRVKGTAQSNDTSAPSGVRRPGVRGS